MSSPEEGNRKAEREKLFELLLGGNHEESQAHSHTLADDPNLKGATGFEAAPPGAIDGHASQAFGDYQLLEEIGSGGMGRVYLARQNSLDRKVAIKILRFDSAFPSQLRERFHLEAKAASALNHPNVCTIYDFGINGDQQPYLTMEYVVGPTLRELKESRSFSPEEIAKLGLQIAAALAAAHEQGIVHRDIKPANIKINPLGLVKVLDFGLAKRFTETSAPSLETHSSGITREGTVVGTPNYMSPEQALGHRVGARSDLFSLGTLLYELLTGQHPFTGRNIPETLHNIVNSDPIPPRADLSPSAAGILDVLKRCLRKSPTDRYASARELVGAFEPLLQDTAWSLIVSSETPDSGLGIEKQTFSPSIREHLNELHREVEKLTQDQFRVLQYLRLLRRVRIAGCAGSGKTLIAAEKTIRLAQAGLPTLFLCHSPLLAKHVSALTRGTGARVAAFKDWVNDLIGATHHTAPEAWSNYDEPDAATLDRAFDQIVTRSIRFDAIIVDEGQDFREVWWTLIEATQDSNGILYIFHDERQALLPHRSYYPINDPVLDLSRNCRNAGRIYELIQHFDDTAPPTEPTLANRGTVHIVRYPHGTECEAINRAFTLAARSEFLERSAFLIGGSERATNSPFRDLIVEVAQGTPWQDEVRHQLERVRMGWRQPRGAPPLPDKSTLAEQLSNLSQSHTPNEQDISLVCDVAKIFRIDTGLEGILPTGPSHRLSSVWDLQQGKLAMKLTRISEVVRTFQQSGWSNGIPTPQRYQLKGTDPLATNTPKGTIPLLDIASFKGLETDCVFLFLRGNDPQLIQQIYVGISRARYALYVIADSTVGKTFPATFTTESHR